MGHQCEKLKRTNLDQMQYEDTYLLPFVNSSVNKKLREEILSRKDLLSTDTDRRDQNPYYSALPAVVSTIQMEFTFGLWASEQNGMEDGASEEYQWFYVTSLLGNVVCIDVQTLVPSFIILTSWSLMRQKLLLLCRHLPFLIWDLPMKDPDEKIEKIW